MLNLFNNSRRGFIKTAAVGTIASLSIPQIVAAASTASKGKKIRLEKDDIILFQGDSITDAGRDKTNLTANNNKALGTGYSFLTTCELLNKHPDKNFTIYNRGISGNKVYQLADRWDNDCLNLKPAVMSIMIGVNDFWHTLTNGYTGTVEVYKNDYIKLLDRTKTALPNLKLIILEPYFVNGIRPEEAKWHPAFDDYQQVAREIAEKYEATFIPLQSIFNEAVKQAPPKYWTPDGVHPSMAGASLISHAWLDVVKG
ncbi:SGNH/GDSL hydrolase family protein [Mucilaginibacter sp. HMF5004]|uniref:SGNH/GDSL hydrolase family protein n=1 Tax=Mucilaginibacter rivuli TaxID=2857527 RepID=UPI001C5DCF19|nr:SGNH/GDSL hydrolase family protein [Mucilaginibacter rivuli]MBW4889353.1 SGNH/GDSL hydrolase family protein [Mucilaginibacter rivuli]